MQKVVGIRFKPAGKIYYFSSEAFVLETGQNVIVQTEQGLGFGTVATPPVPDDQVQAKNPLKKVFRLATEEDFTQRDKNELLEKNAFEHCQECIAKLNLVMNLFSVESTFDANKLTFFFTAEGRVDFRELVKMLVKEFRVRIEMRQVGIRNQAKMCGGLGRCGRELCCSTFLNNFDPVSIRMAKEQGLSLNPTKISGLCGRLMCCLTYENETYMAYKKNFPKIGKIIEVDQKPAKVIRQAILNRQYTVKFEDGTEKEITIDTP
ncbi:MAG: stage 0 sporulation family protein [Proteobacteria bacterium]|nr:stage 0 sporulation family protein [Pseudomonadota bacterium]